MREKSHLLPTVRQIPQHSGIAKLQPGQQVCPDVGVGRSDRDLAEENLSPFALSKGSPLPLEAEGRREKMMMYNLCAMTKYHF